MEMNTGASDQFVKFHANQAGPFNSDNNVVDVVIPGGAVYNLKDSYLQIYTTVASSDTAPVGGISAVYKPVLQLGGRSTHYPNSCLVKNCDMSCSARGNIESIRRSDILSQAKHLVSRSRRTEQTEDYLLANVLTDPNGNVVNSPFLNTKQTGSTLSTYQQVPLPISLSDLMESCSTMMYDGRKLGDLRLRFELNAPGGSNPQITAVPAGIVANATTGYPGWGVCADIAENQATITTLTMNASNRGTNVLLGNSPWYVGQRVNITATGAGGASNINGNAIISGISRDATTGLLTFTFSASIGSTGAGQTYGTVRINAIVDGKDSMTVSFDRVELVAKRIGNPPPMSMPIEWAWRTYETTEDVGPTGVQRFNRQYIMSPESDAVLIAFPDAAGIFSINNNIESYRLAINSVETTDRDIVVGTTANSVSPLSLDRLSDLYDKLGMPISNLTLNSGDSAQTKYDEVYNQPAQRQTIFGTKMPQTAQQKHLGVKVNLTAGEVSNIALFQSSPRGLSY